MAYVVIKCPKTGKVISTGMQMDNMSYQSSTLTHNTTRCRECGGSHTWDKKDSWLQDPVATNPVVH